MVKAACLNPKLNRLMLALSQSILRLGFGSPVQIRRTAPRKRHFCARVMAGCAWEGFGPAGFLIPGLPTCAQFASFCLVAKLADSNRLIRSFIHV